MDTYQGGGVKMNNESPPIDVNNSVKTGTLIRKDLWKRFKRHVKRMYGGKTKWFLSIEVNEALDLYLQVKKGELLVYTPQFLEDQGVYIHTHRHYNTNDNQIVRKFKNQFKNAHMITHKELRIFVIDSLGWTSRSKFYDVRDELLGKDLLEENGENYKSFYVKIED